MKGKPRVVIKYVFQELPSTLIGYSDANWAADKETRKSTSGGVVMFGHHYIKSWSKTQNIVALSSAESELYGVVKCTSELFGIKSALKDWDVVVKSVVKSDASAAMGIIQRQGLGKVRHIDCSYLYLQEINAQKKLTLEKVAGTNNVADLLTKGLDKDSISKYLSFTRARFEKGRSEIAPKV